MGIRVLPDRRSGATHCGPACAPPSLRRAATACLLALLCAGIWGAQPAEAPPAPLSPEAAARADAAHKLARAVLELPVADKTTVRDLVLKIESLASDAAPLIHGAREVGPPRLCADGACQVRLVLSREKVAENVLKILPDAKDKLKDLGRGDDLKATGEGAAPEPPPSATRTPRTAPFRELEGWQGVSEESRVRLEHSAFNDAVCRLTVRLHALPIGSKATVKDVAGGDAAKQAFAGFLSGLRPLRKAYLTGGVVEVELALSGDRLVTELLRLNKEVLPADKRLDDKTLEEARKTLKPRTFVAFGYAGLKGATVDEKALDKTVELNFKDLPKIVLNELEKPK